MRSEQPGYRTTYNYLLSASLHAAGNNGQRSIKSECTSTALRAGDQLIFAFNVPHQSIASLLSTSLTINGWYFTTMPFNLSYGPLALETIRDQRGPLTTLRTAEGASSIIVPVTP
jgi:hypothetical protein